MTIPIELETQLLALYHIEKLPCRSTAKQLHIHCQLVRHMLASTDLPRYSPTTKPIM
jgi:hypothetical protein